MMRILVAAKTHLRKMNVLQAFSSAWMGRVVLNAIGFVKPVLILGRTARMARTKRLMHVLGRTRLIVKATATVMPVSVAMSILVNVSKMDV